LSPIQKNSIDLDCCLLIVLFAMPTAVALLQWTRVLGCGCPILAKISQKIIPERAEFSLGGGSNYKSHNCGADMESSV
jgi:hypothetical protein